MLIDGRSAVSDSCGGLVFRPHQVQASNILLCMVELFLQNLRPNLLHSSILEVFTFIDGKRLQALIGQLMHGNQHCAQQAIHEARKRQAKLQAQVELEAKQQQTDLAIEPSVKHEDTPLVIDAAPNVKEEDSAASTIKQEGAIMPSTISATSTLPASTAPAFAVPILPAAPEHVTTPSSTAATLPYFSAAYGLSRVCHLPIWPRQIFKSLRHRRPRKPRTLSDAATEVVGDGSPSPNKRRREADSDEADEEQPSSKKAKLLAGGSAAMYSGSELDSGSSSMDEDSSDLDSSSTGMSDSESAIDGDGGRRGTSLFGAEDDDTATMEDSGDGMASSEEQGNHARSTHLSYLASRQALERESEADESYFDSWPDDPPAEQKTQQSAVRASSGGGAADGPIRYVLHDDSDEDIFASNAEADSRVTAALCQAEHDAAEKRMAEFQARLKVEREQRAQTEPGINTFRTIQTKRIQEVAQNRSVSSLGGTTTAAAATAGKPLIAFGWGKSKIATSAAPTAAAASTSNELAWIPSINSAPTVSSDATDTHNTAASAPANGHASSARITSNPIDQA
jgi:hypothetical protein